MNTDERKKAAEGAVMALPKIFVFVNSGHGTDWQVGMALAEDGTGLAGHVSSSRDWFKHDMGLRPCIGGCAICDKKREAYRGHYPDGYTLEEIPEGAERAHAGLTLAYQRNQERAIEGGGR